jgi:hypothetical protein
LPRLAPSAVDTRLARAAVLEPSDFAHVPPGWKRLPGTQDETAPDCPGQDYSTLRLTGRAEADFQPLRVSAAGFVGSTVEVFASESQADEAFAIDNRAGTAACEGEGLRKALGASVRLASVRRIVPPAVGHVAVAREYVFSYREGSTEKTLHFFTIEFVRGRAVAVLAATTFAATGGRARAALARAIDRRLT